MRNLLIALWIAALLGGCVVNPVTGQREAGFVSTGQEISVGQQQYRPAQQMQGGAYRTDAELAAYVNEVGQKLARASGRDLPYEFVVLNNSIPNAWALPGGKIAINRGLLLELRNEAELAAVLGHEVAHAAARHGAKRMERGVVTQGVLIATAIGTNGSQFAREALGAAQLAAGFLNQKYSRDAEREADFYGMQFMVDAGYDPLGAVTLQETFVRLSGQRRSNFLEGLFASHPPSTERVENNRRRRSEMRQEGVTGVLGQPAYAAAMAPLRTNKASYAAYDEALAFYEEGKLDAALGAVNRALGGYGAEALFHGLRGAIRMKQGRHSDAVINYNRALERDPQYFSYYLNRGLAHAALNARAEARSDLEGSVRLLPTAGAYQALGKLAEDDGDTEAAKRYYAQASQGQGNTAAAARSSFVRLDLPSRPARYIAAKVVRDEQGRWVMDVKNRSAVGLRDIRLQLELTTAGGVQTSEFTVATLQGGQSRLSLLPIQRGDVVAVKAYAVAARVD